MKHLGKLAVLGAVLAASAQFASATSLFTGSLQTGSAPGVISVTPTQIDITSFSTSSTVTTLTGNYEFPGNDGLPILNGALGTITYEAFNSQSLNTMGGATDVFSVCTNVGCTGPGEDVYTFVATGVQAGSIVDTSSVAGSIILTGYLTDSINGGTSSFANDYNATLDFIEPAGYQNFEENISAGSVTPEPSSLFLLGTGLLGTAGILVRKRQTA